EQEGKDRNEWQRTLGASVILSLFSGIFFWYAMPWRSVFITATVVLVLAIVFAVKWLSTNLDKIFNT
ncbi:MAG: hypothetical protein ACXVHX_38550, partial [Solirubrobacteraceae bacterium]